MADEITITIAVDENNAPIILKGNEWLSDTERLEKFLESVAARDGAGMYELKITLTQIHKI